ncbi:MAG: hypothetical protein HYR96_00405 [Deltaproteobacteria bacterium]|nr:hypothetical protein [Deltaproteobacteria bacterium]MBI3294752.1 hypothetical protein [Deltaproteobacteria bacterium]
MGDMLHFLAILLTVVGLLTWPTFACSNHPPQKASVSDGGGWVASSAGSDTTVASSTNAKIIKGAQGPVSGQRAWSESFFGTPSRGPAATSPEAVTPSADAWSSDIE